MRRIFLAVVLALAVMPARGWHAAVVAPAAVGKAIGLGASAGASAAGPLIAAGAAVAALIYVDRRTKRGCDMRRSTWVDTRHDMIPKVTPFRCEPRRPARDLSGWRLSK